MSLSHRTPRGRSAKARSTRSFVKLIGARWPAAAVRGELEQAIRRPRLLECVLLPAVAEEVCSHPVCSAYKRGRPCIRIHVFSLLIGYFVDLLSLVRKFRCMSMNHSCHVNVLSNCIIIEYDCKKARRLLSRFSYLGVLKTAETNKQ